MAPRTGFFYNFERSEVLAKRFNPSTEAFDDVSTEDTQRIKAGIKDIDSGLGPYPYNSWKKWVGLTSRITPQVCNIRPLPIESLFEKLAAWMWPVLPF